MGEVTGVILAGGRGQRMGGLDKGLQPFLGQRLIDHAVDRLKPQVDRLLIVANRHMDIYSELGCPVVNDASVGPAGRLGEPQAAPDAPLRFEGPMAGLLAGLKASKTPWLATVPCDSPFFPLNLVERLLSVARQQGTSLAVAATQGNKGVALQPVFLLMQADMQAPLAQYLRSGRRRLTDWLTEQKASQVLFDQPDAFANANSLDDLGDLTRKAGRP